LEKNLSNATLATTNSTWPDLGTFWASIKERHQLSACAMAHLSCTPHSPTCSFLS
jgi:hypothetical protein